MRLEVDGKAVFASTGGRPHAASAPLIVFLHGAGMDHSVWSLHSRWFAHHGFRALAVDLPGHGASAGPTLPDIAALAAWTAAVIASFGGKARIVGHSLGALAALATAARFAEKVDAIALVAVAEKMPVHPDLLAAAQANRHEAVDMVTIWSLGGPATRGGAPNPGLWMLGGVERLLERAEPGVLHADLLACNAYADADSDAACVRCPAFIVLGERDIMTPAKSGLALASRIAGAKTTVVPGAGHMLTVERPDETLEALKDLALI